MMCNETFGAAFSRRTMLGGAATALGLAATSGTPAAAAPFGDGNSLGSGSAEPNGLIDVHSHFVTDSYIAAASAAGHTAPDGMPAWPTWSVQRHLELMDASNIATSILSISSPGVHFGNDAAARALAREVNEFAANIAIEHPDRFGHFAALPLPDIEGAVAEAEYALDTLGVDGVTMLTNSGGMYLGDPNLEPLLDVLNRRGATVFVHPTSPPHWESVSPTRPRPIIEFLFDSARAVVDLVLTDRLDRYPAIKWVFTHGGGVLPLLADRVDLFQATFGGGAGTFSERLATLWYDSAGSPFPRQLPALVDVVGTDRIVYGSDYCFTPAPGVTAQLASIDSAAPPRAGRNWRALTTANAQRLLPTLTT